MRIFPAIDLSGGRVVRLLRGDYQNKTVYEGAPKDTARAFYEAGARYLHLVDLDGAKDGEPRNREAIRTICGVGGLYIEVGGGVRDEKRIEEYLSMGVSRVILGTIAVKDPAFVRDMAARYGAAIAVGVDARDGRVAVSGWLEDTALDAYDFCVRMRDSGVAAVIYTDIACDGALSGPNLDAYRRLGAIRGLELTASGGIGGIGDVEALTKTGVSAAIIGRALYEGKVDLCEALAVAGRQDG